MVLTPRLCEHCELPLPTGKGSGSRLMHEECKMLTVNLPRRCKKCRKVKPASGFSRDASRSEGRYPYCKPCQVANQDKFQNPDDELNGHLCPLDDVPIRGHRNRRFCSTPCKDRVSALRKRFGMEVLDYRRLLDDAAGRCPICGQRPKSWSVDHNHSTGRSTGIVCHTCNVGLLAYSLHDLSRAQALLRYLTETPCERLGIVAIAPEGQTPASNLHTVWGRSRRPTST